MHRFSIQLVSRGAKRIKEGKYCDGGVEAGEEGGLALVRNEDVKINEASAGSDAG